MSVEDFIEDKKDEMMDNLSEIFHSSDSFVKVGIALLLGIFMVKPAFQLSFLTGLMFLGTMIWLFLFKAHLFVRQPGYIIVVFGILAIRGAIGDIRGEGVLFLEKGDFVSAAAFLITWLIIYLKTKEIQRH